MKGSGIAALAIDLVMGEPPARLHPTVGMGAWIARGRSRRRSSAPRESFVDGAMVVGSGAALVGSLAFMTERALRALSGPTRLIAEGAALKSAISLRALLDAATDVENALRGGNLNRARELLSWHLVSRETSMLDASDVAAATIESVAENLNDGLVAPLLMHRVGGLTGAYLFRFINTADAMLGYRTPELEWFGRSAARLDDAAAFVPARCTAFSIALAAVLTGDSGTGALRAMFDDADKTASPNAGCPMSAMAGALGVRLEKRGHYRLNDSARAPRARDIFRAKRIVLVAAVVAAITVDLA